MGFIPGPARSRTRATLDTIVGASQIALGGAMGIYIISKAPELYELMQEVAYNPVLATAIPSAIVGVPAYLITRGAMRIKNLRYEPEHESDYAHKGLMDRLHEMVNGASSGPYGSAPSVPGNAPA
jgi:hypothetical protein